MGLDSRAVSFLVSAHAELNLFLIHSRRVPDILRSIIVNLDRYHTSNRLAARANENGPVTGGCPISSMVTVNIHGQHLYRELNNVRSAQQIGTDG